MDRHMNKPYVKPGKRVHRAVQGRPSDPDAKAKKVVADFFKKRDA